MCIFDKYCEGGYIMKENVLWLAIKKVIEDKKATDEQKLERIGTYLEVHEANSRQSMSDMI
jgi:hypothetical protein